MGIWLRVNKTQFNASIWSICFSFLCHVGAERDSLEEEPEYRMEGAELRSLCFNWGARTFCQAGQFLLLTIANSNVE